MTLSESIKEFIIQVFHWLSSSYWGGLICILIGTLFFWFNLNYPFRKGDVSQGDLQGWIASIAFITGGLLVIYLKLMENL